MKNALRYIALMLALSACHSKSSTPKVDSVAAYTVPDEKAIKKAVDDAYTSISFKKGEQPRYDAIKNYFIPQAQFIHFRGDTTQVLNLGQFVYLYRTFIEGDSVKLVYEHEIFGKTEQFGKIAERMSTYETYMNTMDTVAERGVNSFQLIKTKQGWKVSSIIWDVEKKGLVVPGYYLGK